MATINDVRLVELPKILDERGNLSFVENYAQIPFEIQRTYWVYDVPGGESRDAHAFRENEEFIIAISGSFDVNVNDGKEQKKFSLNRSYYGLFIPKGIWFWLDNFSTNSLALRFASTKYNRKDYVEDYEEYLKLVSNGEI